MTFRIIGLTFLLSAAAFAQPSLPPPPPKVAAPVQVKVELSSPVLAIRSVVAALNRYDLVQAAQCVNGGKTDDPTKLAPLAELFGKMRGQFSISEPRIQEQGEWALATLHIKMTPQAGPQNPQPDIPAQSERVLLRRVDGQWKIVSNPAMMAAFEQDEPKQTDPKPVEIENPPPGLEHGNGFITSMASFLVNPAFADKARGNAQRASCQSNLKQLALAALQMQQDFDGVYAFDKAAKKLSAADAANQTLVALLHRNWQKALYPYSKTPQIYFCPLRREKPVNAEEQARRDKMMDDLGIRRSGEPYALNAHLEGLNLDDVTQPSRTVLFYEGADGKLDFRHNGKSNVAFADGHVKAIGPDEAETLIWNPKGKNP